MENPFYDFDHPFEDVKPHEDRLDKPYHWRKARKVFTTSTGDLFVGDVPTEFILQVFGVIQDLPRHTFQVLTKRPQRMARLDLPWPANVWAGTRWRIRIGPGDLTICARSLKPPCGGSRSSHCWARSAWTSPTSTGWSSAARAGRPSTVPSSRWTWTGRRDVVRQARAAGVAVFVKQMGSRWATRHRRATAPSHGGCLASGMAGCRSSGLRTCVSVSSRRCPWARPGDDSERRLLPMAHPEWRPVGSGYPVMPASPACVPIVARSDSQALHCTSKSSRYLPIVVSPPPIFPPVLDFMSSHRASPFFLWGEGSPALPVCSKAVRSVRLPRPGSGRKYDELGDMAAFANPFRDESDMNRGGYRPRLAWPYAHVCCHHRHPHRPPGLRP